MIRWLILWSFAASVAAQEPPNAVLLVAKPGLTDVYFGGPVMREVLVALYRSDRTPDASAFHVLKGVYLTMHPQNIERLLAKPGNGYRLYAGFSGWAPGQLESELARDGWYLRSASAELVFRQDTSGMWDELVRKARGRVAMR